MKLSERFIRVASAIAWHVGEDFGLYPDVVLPSSAKHYFTDICCIEANNSSKPCFFAYSFWIDEKYFYFCFYNSIYQCRRYLHLALCIEEIAAFMYLVFCKHQTFNL